MRIFDCKKNQLASWTARKFTIPAIELLFRVASVPFEFQTGHSHTHSFNFRRIFVSNARLIGMLPQSSLFFSRKSGNRKGLKKKKIYHQMKRRVKTCGSKLVSFFDDSFGHLRVYWSPSNFTKKPASRSIIGPHCLVWKVWNLRLWLIFVSIENFRIEIVRKKSRNLASCLF